MAIPEAKRILIAPLDWGAGHTTRCLPIIRYVQHLGHIPIVCGNDQQRAIIEKNIGGINFIHLEGYNVTYSGWNKYAQIGLLSQLPRLSKIIHAEHEWLSQQINDQHIDGIISDNRYGFYHNYVPSVMLIHQLQIQTGVGRVVNNIVQKIHYKYLNRFREAWVVDQKDFFNLGGKLSHPSLLPENTKYIGLLSQFEDANVDRITDGSLLILLSGPEPQRSILSGILWKQLQHYKGKVIFIEGSNAASIPSFIPHHITYHKWLAKEALLEVIRNANMVICRSGYSTIMDLVVMRKKAILIPTPGQTEQLYLSDYLQEEKLFYSVSQNRFNLYKSLNDAASFSCEAPDIKDAYSEYKKVLSEWIARL